MKKELILHSKIKRTQPDRCRFYKADIDKHVASYHLAQVPKFLVPSGRKILCHVRLQTARE